MRILCETGDGDLIFFSARKKLEKRLTNKGGNDHPLLTVFQPIFTQPNYRGHVKEMEALGNPVKEEEEEEEAANVAFRVVQTRSKQISPSISCAYTRVPPTQRQADGRACI